MHSSVGSRYEQWGGARVRHGRSSPADLSRPFIRLAFIAALLLVLCSYTPPVEPRFRLCGFHWLTGRPCPLCGLTHAIFALAKGHWGQALGFNALSPVGFAMLFGLFWDSPVRGRLWTVGVAAFAVYGVLRVFIAGA
jgi:hypothetical protein